LAALAALVDGNSERAVERMVTINRRTVSSLALKFGDGARRLHDALVRDLSCSHVEVDEIWSFIAKKQKRVTEADPPSFGEAYTYTAMDRGSRLLIAYYVGPRNEESTRTFINDLRSRLVVMPAMTSDGWTPYIAAIGGNFGGNVDYAQTVKNYSQGGRRNGGDDHRYEPPREPFIAKRAIYGAPDLDRASTAYIERSNGTMRHFIGRMRRLCYGFSKRSENHRAAWSLAVCHYNFCHVVRTLRVTPAMQAGITDHIWDIAEFFDAVMHAPAVEPPRMQPLAHRRPETASRELPGGRGFLRVVPPRPGTSSLPPTTGTPPRPPPMQLRLRLFDDEPKEPS
jgi:IS1 family transposase